MARQNPTLQKAKRSTPTRVLTVDDHDIVLEGIRAVLRHEQDMELVGEARTAKDAVSLALKLKPHAVVMDIAMPEMSGVEAALEIKRQLPGTEIVGFSVHSERAYVRSMLQAGALGYVLKDRASKELVDAIRAAAKGQHYLSAGLAEEVLSDYACPDTSGALGAARRLTKKEREILRLCAREDLSVKEMGARLKIGQTTVKTHLYRIRRKLGIKTRAGLVKYAIEQGFLLPGN